MKQFTRQLGISLVEVLVALVISVFLLGGIVQVYVGNKATFTFTNALAEIQENGRFALDTMSQDLRLAGVWGCIAFDSSDTSNINNTLGAATVPTYNSDLHDFHLEEAVEGTDGGGLNGSDSLTLRGSKPGQANVESPFVAPATQTIITNGINTIGANDIILVTRCGANDLLVAAEADILRVTGVLPLPIPTQRQLSVSANKSQQFENDATVIELQTVTYTVAAGATGEPALFRSEFGNAQELVEGVEDMQVLYGVDSDNDQFPNQYVTANNVLDFEDVVSVRIMLLVRSSDPNVTEGPQVYSFNGAQVTPGDNRLRQVFTTTIALRNRIGTS